jgi:hypothetical protein
MRYVVIALLLCASQALAQSDKIGLGFSAQTGFEYILYEERYPTDDGGTGTYSGSNIAIAGTVSIEYDLEAQLGLPLFVAAAVGMPLHTFASEDRNTIRRDGREYLTQTNSVKHEYTRYRAFIGYKLKPHFQPFALFERALFQSTRWDMKVGTDEGKLVQADPDVTWHERVWSSHIGGGVQGGVPLTADKALSARFRTAILFPIASFVTNDHPAVFTQDRSIGKNAEGMSILSRVALHYNWRENSSVQLGVNWYYRRWEGTQSRTGPTWPENSMDAIPILLAFTWGI